MVYGYIWYPTCIRHVSNDIPLVVGDLHQEWGEMSSTLDDDSRDRASRSRDEKVEKGGRSPRAAQIEVPRGCPGSGAELGTGGNYGGNCGFQWVLVASMEV